MIICGAHGRLSMGIRHLRIIYTDRNRSSWTIETDLHDTLLTSHTEWIINYMKCNSDPGRRSSNLVTAAGYRKIRACSSTTRYSRRTIPILVRYSTLHGALLKKSLEMITPTRWLKEKRYWQMCKRNNLNKPVGRSNWSCNRGRWYTLQEWHF